MPRRCIAYFTLSCVSVVIAIAWLAFDSQSGIRAVALYAHPKTSARQSSSTRVDVVTTPQAAPSGASFSVDEDISGAISELSHALSSASEEDFDRLAAQYLARIVRLDAQVAARLAELETRRELREVLLRHVARVWGGLDAEAASAWAHSLPTIHERHTVEIEVCLAISERSPETAMARCAGLQGRPVADVALQSVFQTWAESDVVGARNWLLAQPAETSGALRQRYLFSLAKTNPVEALRQGDEGFTAPFDRDETMIAILHRWATREPHAAREWIDHYPPGPMKNRAISELDGLEAYAAAK